MPRGQRITLFIHIYIVLLVISLEVFLHMVQSNMSNFKQIYLTQRENSNRSM